MLKAPHLLVHVVSVDFGRLKQQATVDPKGHHVLGAAMQRVLEVNQVLVVAPKIVRVVFDTFAPLLNRAETKMLPRLSQRRHRAQQRFRAQHARVQTR